MSKHSYEIDWTPEQTKTNEQAGKSYSNTNYMYTNFAQQGWQCPICKRVLAPFVPECPCGGQGMLTWTTTSTEGTDNKTITLDSDLQIKAPNCFYTDKEKDEINSVVSEEVYKKLNKVSKHMKGDK